jgi:hypothetical protein
VTKIENLKYKYTLIISQYRWSRHFFIVKHDENFIENARKFATELMEYKNSSDSKRELYLGDLDPTYLKAEIRRRYNINDHGDIYFIQSTSANFLMSESWSYKEDTRRESRGFQKKSDKQSISDHHEYYKVKEILNKYFEIA